MDDQYFDIESIRDMARRANRSTFWASHVYDTVGLVFAWTGGTAVVILSILAAVWYWAKLDPAYWFFALCGAGGAVIGITGLYGYRAYREAREEEPIVNLFPQARPLPSEPEPEPAPAGRLHPHGPGHQLAIASISESNRNAIYNAIIKHPDEVLVRDNLRPLWNRHGGASPWRWGDTIKALRDGGVLDENNQPTPEGWDFLTP